jgi:hypothetical protein
VSATDSEAGSVTVARHEPAASGSVAAIAEVPPTLWLEPGHVTTIVRYVGPDHTTDISMAPVPVNANTPDVFPGGSSRPGDWVRSAACTGARLGVVVGVVAGTPVVGATPVGAGMLVAEAEADAAGDAGDDGPHWGGLSAAAGVDVVGAEVAAIGACVTVPTCVREPTVPGPSPTRAAKRGGLWLCARAE